MRIPTLLSLLLLSAASWAGTITVTSPVAGDFLGTSNSVKFNITGAVVQVTVNVVASLDSNPAINVSVQQNFSPDVNGNINGSIPLNFSPSTPEGPYTLTVTATEPGATYNTVAPISVNVDVKAPKFGNFNPLSGAFVKGVVPISVDLDEPNVKEWRVRINNADIPNNSGSTNVMLVDWDTNTVVTDGSQTINLSVTDLANNSSTKDIGVTVDRIKPSSTILAPASGSTVRPGSRLAVIVDIADQFTGSVHFTGVDVEIQSMTGTVLHRVPRRSISSTGSTLHWTGRIRTTAALPSQFKIVVNAIDRAGNVAVTQEVTVSTATANASTRGGKKKRRGGRGRI
ncbi:MAG TPA: hypothetical protein VNI20_02560 [Fimbriimonadaceae bacterium]|nr:hypothetical protein [Fimbriimonadaceae bacterium]